MVQLCGTAQSLRPSPSGVRQGVRMRFSRRPPAYVLDIVAFGAELSTAVLSLATHSWERFIMVAKIYSLLCFLLFQKNMFLQKSVFQKVGGVDPIGVLNTKRCTGYIPTKVEMKEHNCQRAMTDRMGGGKKVWWPLGAWAVNVSHACLKYHKKGE